MTPNMPSSGRVDVRAVLDDAAQMWWRERFRGDAERAELAIAAFEELIAAANSEAIGDIRSALTKAHEVLSGIAANGRKYGPIYSHANTASWQASNAIKRLDRIDAALANIGAAP